MGQSPRSRSIRMLATWFWTVCELPADVLRAVCAWWFRGGSLHQSASITTMAVALVVVPAGVVCQLALCVTYLTKKQAATMLRMHPAKGCLADCWFCTAGLPGITVTASGWLLVLVIYTQCLLRCWLEHFCTLLLGSTRLLYVRHSTLSAGLLTAVLEDQTCRCAAVLACCVTLL